MEVGRAMTLSLVRNLPYTHPHRWDGSLFGYPVLWRPNQIGSALALWLDAEDVSTITLNGSTVSQWSDKSGNSRHFTQATAASQPTYNATVLGGKPALTFDGTSDFMSAGDTLDVGVNGLTIMSVVKYATNNQSGVIIGKTRFAGGAGRYALYRSLASGLFGTGAMFATALVSPEAPNSYAPQVSDSSTNTKIFGLGWDRSPGAVRIWDNGTNTATASYTGDNNNLNSADELWIGAYQNVTGTAPPMPASYLNGQIAEIVIALPTSSSNDRQRLEGYLAWKWLLESSLPDDHPYKNIPPVA